VARLLALVAIVVTAAPSLGSPASLQAQVPGDAAAPLRELGPLVGPSWTAQGEGFRTTLAYRWLLEGHVLEAVNDVQAPDGRVIAHYRGMYAWDAGRGEIVFFTASGSGEIHRGRAWWRDGVLWHEAEVSGGRISGYASAVRPGADRMEYFADYATREASPALLDTTPIVYTPAP
jgi:hypothetical protein